MPDGVQSVVIDPESLELATPNCPTTRSEVYVAGSAPTQFCELHGGHNVLSSTGSFLSHVFGGGGDPKPPQPGTDVQPGQTTQPANRYDPNRPPDATGQGQPVDASAKPDEKKKGPLKKIFGIFGGKKKDSDKDDKDKDKRDKPPSQPE